VKAIFADTYYWAALTSPGDGAYPRALEFSRSLRPDRIVTSDDVLVEYLAFFAKSHHTIRAQAGNLVSGLLKTSGVLVIPQSRKLFMAGLGLYCARPDKGYSLTDCISMQIMRLQGLTDVLTNDRHFEQEGFQALFREA
jgi:predicted nucleic acid-binding protein